MEAGPAEEVAAEGDDGVLGRVEADVALEGAVVGVVVLLLLIVLVGLLLFVLVLFRFVWK